MHEDEFHGPSKGEHLWVSERDNPKGKQARAGELGTVANCLPGDVVCVEFVGRGRVVHCFASIGWVWPDGDVQAHLAPPGQPISLRSEHLRLLRAGQRVRFVKVRGR